MRQANKKPAGELLGGETVYWASGEMASGRPEFYPRRLWGCNGNCQVPKTEGPPALTLGVAECRFFTDA